MILEAEHLLRDSKTDTIYTRMTSTAIGIGQGGYGGPRGPTRPSYPPPDRQPDAVHVFQTTPEQALLYHLCGDYNPMHADDEFGKRAGFKGAILQGLGTWNIVAHGILMKMGDSDPSRFSSFKARFASVVYPGMQSSQQRPKPVLTRRQEIVLRQECGQSTPQMELLKSFFRLPSSQMDGWYCQWCLGSAASPSCFC